MDTTKPWVTGAAFSVTFAVIYVACALAVVLFPDGTLAFFNIWAHGIDLNAIKRGPGKAPSFNDWGVGFATAIAAGFLVGALYQWARNVVAALSRPQGM